MSKPKKKIPVVVLGATGMVGQQFVRLLSGHPWFEIEALAASGNSRGKSYGEAVRWVAREPIPSAVADMRVVSCHSNFRAPLLFSGLDAAIAGDIEEEQANRGHVVISNSRNHRLHPRVPLLIPEVNKDHLQLVKNQDFGGGAIVTNPNCAVIGVALAIKALHERFGIRQLSVTTMQAVSGAGLKGLVNPEFRDNIVPYIAGEEEKIEKELLKIFGVYKEGRIENDSFAVSAQCNRVPVADGHTKCVAVRLIKKASRRDILQAWEEFAALPGLPSSPRRVIYYFAEDSYPQPKLHRDLARGMAIAIGRLRSCPILDYKFVALSHNTVRGGAGTAILNAELIVREGLLDPLPFADGVYGCQQDSDVIETPSTKCQLL